MSILVLDMRRNLAILGVTAVLLPASAAAITRAPGDGTLAVRAATGTITVNGRGAVFGHIDKGRFTFKDPSPLDGTGPIVFGAAKTIDKGDGITTTYIGSDMKFRLIGGKYMLRIVGAGIDLSVVGQGKVTLEGGDVIDDGTYSFNGDDYHSLPNFEKSFTLAAPNAAP